MGLLNRLASFFQHDSSKKSTKKSTKKSGSKQSNSKRSTKKADSKKSTKSESKKSARKTQREPIPHELRDQVWMKYHGIKIEGPCYCCNSVIQKYHGWHCAHVKADVKGGATDLENLRTCCEHCNLSMGNQNLYVYIRDKDLKGPGRKNASKYLKKHSSQVNDRRTNNWGH